MRPQTANGETAACARACVPYDSHASILLGEACLSDVWLFHSMLVLRGVAVASSPLALVGLLPACACLWPGLEVLRCVFSRSVLAVAVTLTPRGGGGLFTARDASIMPEPAIAGRRFDVLVEGNLCA